ncbi:hypothetical protein FRB96_003899 [Tulasnella sp. 330]|nr:hypothetical protein FRB96_003899 [Tulasnella sp. 330]
MPVDPEAEPDENGQLDTIGTESKVAVLILGLCHCVDEDIVVGVYGAIGGGSALCAPSEVSMTDSKRRRTLRISESL